jgi:ribonuclease HII
MNIYIDEAWRWPIAWPVVVGLVRGTDTTDRSSYQDSKSLTPKQRELLYHKIASDPSIIRATGSASAKETDRNGIIWALRWATIRGLHHLIRLVIARNEAIQWISSKWKQCYRKKLIQDLRLVTHNSIPVTLIIDWNHTFWLDAALWINVQTIIKWDRDVPAISAASILAKVTRDREMIKMWTSYPWYGLEQHMWYGTSKHYQAIKEWGLCEIHRKKWIKL